MMIKRILLMLVFVLIKQFAYSQIGIGTTTPDGSSVLDVSSTDKGLLFPRMTTPQRDAIVNPAKGLAVYNLDEDCLQMNSGSPSSPDWPCVGGSSSASVVNNCDVNGFEGAYPNGGALTASNIFSVTIHNNSFNSSTISFTTGDLVLSGVSGISVSSVSPASATITSGGSQLVEYTLTGTPSSLGTLTGVWTKLGLNCTKTVNMVNGDATFTFPRTAIVVSVNDDTPLVDIQGVIDNTSNQLTVSIPYTDGVGTYEAYTGTYTISNAGTGEGGDVNSFRLTYPSGTFSASGSITATIEVDGDEIFNAAKELFGTQESIASLDFQVNGTSKGHVNLDVVGGIPDRNFADADHKFIYLPIATADGNTWLNHNLGADYSNINHAQFNPAQQATAHNDHHAYGSLFQWGRYSDGHELMTYTSSTDGTPVTTTTSSSHSTTITPNNSTFYVGDDSPSTQDYNWLDFGSSPNATENGLWQGEAGPNNPCPHGYRLPTEAEVTTLVSALGITNTMTAASSTLALAASGVRASSNGTVFFQSEYATTWTSTLINGSDSRNYVATSSVSTMINNRRANSFGIRCIED